MNTNNPTATNLLIVLTVVSVGACNNIAPAPADQTAPQRAALDECLDQTDCWISDTQGLLGPGADGTGCSDATDSLPMCDDGEIRMGLANLTTACTGPTVPCPSDMVCFTDADLPPSGNDQTGAPPDCNSGDPVACIEHFCVDPKDAASCHVAQFEFDPTALTAATLSRLDGAGPVQPDECATPDSNPKRRGELWCKAYHQCQSRRLVDPVPPGWLRTVSESAGDATVEDWLFFSNPAGCTVEVFVDTSESAPVTSFVCADTPCQGLLHTGCQAQ